VKQTNNHKSNILGAKEVTRKLGGFASRKIVQKNVFKAGKKNSFDVAKTGYIYSGLKKYSKQPHWRLSGPGGWHVDQEYFDSLKWCGPAHGPYASKYLSLKKKYGDDIEWGGYFHSSGQSRSTVIFDYIAELLPDGYETFIDDDLMPIPSYTWQREEDDRYHEPIMGDNYDHLGAMSYGAPINVEPMWMGTHKILILDIENPIWDYDDLGVEVAYVPITLNPHLEGSQHPTKFSSFWDSGMTTHLDGFFNVVSWNETEKTNTLNGREPSSPGYPGGYWYQELHKQDDWMQKACLKTGRVWYDRRIGRYRHVFDKYENRKYIQRHAFPYQGMRHKMADRLISETQSGKSDLGLLLEYIPNYDISESEPYVYEVVDVTMKDGQVCAVIYDLKNLFLGNEYHSNVWDAGGGAGYDYSTARTIKIYCGSLDLMCSDLSINSSSRQSVDDGSFSLSFSDTNTSKINESSHEGIFAGLDTPSWKKIRTTHTSEKLSSDTFLNKFKMVSPTGFQDDSVIKIGYDWITEADKEHRFKSFPISKKTELWTGEVISGNAEQVIDETYSKNNSLPSFTKEDVVYTASYQQKVSELNVSSYDQYTFLTNFVHVKRDLSANTLGDDKIKIQLDSVCEHSDEFEIGINVNIVSQKLDIIIQLRSDGKYHSTRRLGGIRGRKYITTTVKKKKNDLTNISFRAILVKQSRYPNESSQVISDHEAEAILCTDYSNQLISLNSNSIKIESNDTHLVIKNDTSKIFEYQVNDGDVYNLALAKDTDNNGLRVYINGINEFTIEFSGGHINYDINKKHISDFLVFGVFVDNTTIQQSHEYLRSVDRDEYNTWYLEYKRGNKTTYEFTSPCEVNLENANPVMEYGNPNISFDGNDLTGMLLKRKNSNYAFSEKFDGHEIKEILGEGKNSALFSKIANGEELTDIENELVTKTLADAILASTVPYSMAMGYSVGAWGEFGSYALDFTFFILDVIDVMTLGLSALTIGVVKFTFRHGIVMSTRQLPPATILGAFSSASKYIQDNVWRNEYFLIISRFIRANANKFANIQVHRYLPVPMYNDAGIRTGFRWPLSSHRTITERAAGDINEAVGSHPFNIWQNHKGHTQSPTHGTVVEGQANLADDFCARWNGANSIANNPKYPSPPSTIDHVGDSQRLLDKIRFGSVDIKIPVDPEVTKKMNALTPDSIKVWSKKGNSTTRKMVLTNLKSNLWAYDKVKQSILNPKNYKVLTKQLVAQSTKNGDLFVDIDWITRMRTELVQRGADASQIEEALKSSFISEISRNVGEEGLSQSQIDAFTKLLDESAPPNTISSASKKLNAITDAHIDNAVDITNTEHIGKFLFESFLTTNMPALKIWNMSDTFSSSLILKELADKGDGGEAFLKLASILQDSSFNKRALASGDNIFEEAREPFGVLDGAAASSESSIIREGGRTDGIGKNGCIPLGHVKFTTALSKVKAGETNIANLHKKSPISRGMNNEVTELLNTYTELGDIFDQIAKGNILSVEAIDQSLLKLCPALKQIVPMESGYVKDELTYAIWNAIEARKSEYQKIADTAKPLGASTLPTASVDRKLSYFESGVSCKAFYEEGELVLSATRMQITDEVVGKNTLVQKLFCNADTLARAKSGNLTLDDDVVVLASGIADTANWPGGSQMDDFLQGVSELDSFRPATQQTSFGNLANKESARAALEIVANATEGVGDLMGKSTRPGNQQNEVFEEGLGHITSSSKTDEMARTGQSILNDNATKYYNRSNPNMGPRVHKAWGAAQSARKVVPGHRLKSDVIKAFKPGDKLYDEIVGRLTNSNVTKEQWNKAGVRWTGPDPDTNEILVVCNGGFGPNITNPGYTKVADQDEAGDVLWEIQGDQVDKYIGNWLKGEHSVIDNVDSYNRLSDEVKQMDLNIVEKIAQAVDPYFAPNVTVRELNSVNAARGGPLSMIQDPGIQVDLGAISSAFDGATAMVIPPVNSVATDIAKWEDVLNAPVSLVESEMAPILYAARAQKETLEQIRKNTPPVAPTPPKFVNTDTGIKYTKPIRQAKGAALKHASSVRNWPGLASVIGSVASTIKLFDGIIKKGSKKQSITSSATNELSSIQATTSDYSTALGQAIDAPGGNPPNTDQYYAYYNKDNVFGAEGSVELRKTRTHEVVMKMYFTEVMALKGVTIGEDSSGSGPVQELIDTDPKYKCVSLVQYKSAQGNEVSEWQWEADCHPEQAGFLGELDGPGSPQLGSTPPNALGQGWTRLFGVTPKQPRPKIGLFVNYRKQLPVPPKSYYLSPDGRIYSSPPPFVW